MAFLKPSGITGLNVSHPLYSKINGFWEIGQLDKELIGDTSIAYAVTPTYENNPSLGDSRRFQGGANSFPTNFIPSNSGTIVIVCQYNNNISISQSPYIIERSFNGNLFNFGANLFSSVNAFEIRYRGGFGSTRVNNYSPSFTTNEQLQTAHAAGASWNNAVGLDVTYDGNAIDALAGTTNAYSDAVAIPFCSNAILDANISAIVWFDELTDTELVDITTDGNFWQLVSTGGGGPTTHNVTITDTLPALLSTLSLTNDGVTTELSISDTFAALQSTLSLQNTLPEYNVDIVDTLPSLTSTLSLSYFVDDVGLVISATLPALESSLSLNVLTPQYNTSISDTFGVLQSSISLVNGIPENNISISGTLPSLASAISIINTVPEYNLTINQSLPSLISSVGLTYADATYSVSISDTLPSLESTVTLTNVVPEYTLTINDTFAPLTSSVNIINGEVLVYVSKRNLVSFKTPSTTIAIKSKSNFIKIK